MKAATKWSLLGSVFGVAVAMCATRAEAGSVTLTFGDLVNGTYIENWFNGGQSSPPQLTNGPSDGVVFSANADELRRGTNGHAPSGGSGRFENNPSGVNGVLYFPFSSSSLNNDTASYINVAGGFTGLSFYYSLIENSTSSFGEDTVKLYSGLNGSGSVLATLALAPNSATVACTTTGDEFCTWSLASFSNFGVAQSVYFGPLQSTPLEGYEFDDFTFSTPLPAALPLFAGGLGVISLFGLRRKRKSRAAA